MYYIEPKQNTYPKKEAHKKQPNKLSVSVDTSEPHGVEGYQSLQAPPPPKHDVT